MTTAIVEIALLWVIVIGSPMFWQLWKRTQFVSRMLKEQSYLNEFVAHMLPTHTPTLPQYGQRNDIGWFVTIISIIQADKAAIKAATMRVCLVLLIAVVISYFLGYILLAINILVFFSFAFQKLRFAAETSAHAHVLDIAYVLRIWIRENRVECEQWVNQAHILKPLFLAVNRS